MGVGVWCEVKEEIKPVLMSAQAKQISPDQKSVKPSSGPGRPTQRRSKD